MQLFDTHAHLDEEAFETDRDEVIARATEAGLVAVVTIGTTAPTSVRSVELAEQYPLLHAAVGIQPNYAAEANAGDWETIVELASNPQVVAIGETGLDRYWDYAPMDVQVDYFRRHLALAAERDLPFIVHCREAEADVVRELQQAAESGPLRGVMHSFAGDAETVRTCLELGMHISFAGMVTFKKSDALRAVAAEIPSDRLLIETDAPYLAPTPNRGKRNEPAFVRHTLECLADVRGVPIEELAEQTMRNARAFFGL